MHPSRLSDDAIAEIHIMWDHRATIDRLAAMYHTTPEMIRKIIAMPRKEGKHN